MKVDMWTGEKIEPYCKCGYPDMPGSCPGWRNCPMCAEDEEESTPVTDENS